VTLLDSTCGCLRNGCEYVQGDASFTIISCSLDRRCENQSDTYCNLPSGTLLLALYPNLYRYSFTALRRYLPGWLSSQCKEKHRMNQCCASFTDQWQAGGITLSLCAVVIYFDSTIHIFQTELDVHKFWSLRNVDISKKEILLITFVS